MELVYDCLKNHIREVSVRNKKNEITEVLSVTNKDGFIKSKDFFSKEVYSKNLSNYKVVKRNQVAYNPSRINVGSIDVLNNFEQGIISPLYVVFECKDELNPNFLKYYLKSDIGKKMIANNTSGSVRDTLKYSSLCDIKIRMLPKELQEKSVIVLDKAQELIDKRKAQIEDLDDLVKSRFIEMFGNPVINEKNITKVKIGKVFEIKTGATPSRKEKEYWENGNIPWIKTTELKENIINKAEEYITKVGFDRSSVNLLPKDTVLIAMYGQGKTRGMTGKLAIEATTNQACAALLPNNRDNMDFVWYELILLYNDLRELGRGGNQPNLNTNLIKNFELILPAIELQNQFADFVNQVDRLKSEMKQNLKELEDNFNSLIQRAFKGELFN